MPLLRTEWPPNTKPEGAIVASQYDYVGIASYLLGELKEMKPKFLDKTEKKEAMKQLRDRRKKSILAASALMKQQKKEMKSIREFLESGDATIPSISQGVALPVNQTLWYVMAMKKYGEVLEGAKEGAYFKYTLNPDVIAGKNEKEALKSHETKKAGAS